MVAAPPSWAAATNRAPPATRALVTWKFPLPTTPKTISTPCAARLSPTASATSTVDTNPSCPLDQGQHPARAAGAAHDRQRSGDHDRPGRWQRGQVLQLGQPVFARAEQERVARERRLERVGQPGVGADGLHTNALDGCLLSQPARAL